MRKSKQPFPLLLGLCIALLLVASCHKSDIVPMANSPRNVVDTLPQTIYNIRDSSGSPTPGIILAAPIHIADVGSVDSPGLLMIMNQVGQVLKEKATPGQAFDFNRWTIDGQTRYTYLVDDPSTIHNYGVIQDGGFAVIADSNLNTLNVVNFTPFGQTVFPSGQGLDLHDFMLISDNDYIVQADILKVVTNIPFYVPQADTVRVMAPLLEEVSNGVVVWSWDGSQDTSFYGNSVVGNAFTNADTAQDYMHMNSFIIDPRDNNLICSLRNLSQIIKINRQTGVVMWRLGGKNSDFPLTSDQVFLFQHNATLTDNNQTLLLFDDGDAKLRASSRVDEFQLDETNKVVTSFKTFTIPEPFTFVMGSVQKMGNEYFIGGGSSNYILDINYVTGQKILEMKSSVFANYRAFKY